MSINKKLFSKAAGATDTFEPTKNFNTVLYTGTGATQKVGAYINQGGEFNGSNSSLLVPNNMLNPNEHSVSVWFNLNTTSGIQTILEFDFENRILYRAVSTDANKAYIGNSGYFNHGNSYSTNQWYHLVITFKAGSPYKIYVDGTNTNTGGNTSIAAFSNDNIIGASNTSGGGGLDGKLDQVRIFNKELTQTEVNQLNAENFDSATKSTTDIFGDRSGIALYQFENNANDTGGASGYLNEGAIFNGSSSTINTSLTTNFSNLTISCWVYFNALPTGGADATLVSKGFFTSSSNCQFIHLRYEDSTSQFKFSVRENSSYNQQAASGVTATLGVWYNVVGTLDSSGNAQIYVNGSAGTGISSAPTMTNSDDFEIGSFATTSALLDGKIDEVRIYSDVLTATEVGHIASNTTASIPTDNLEAYYKLDGTFQDEQQTHDGVGSNVTFRYDGTANNINFQGATRFTPDWVWAKRRSDTEDNVVFDSVRGVQKQLRTNATGVESTKTNAISSFNSNGFTTGSNNALNTNNETYVAWCWKGGGAAVTNDTGSRDTQVSANTAAGFSIVSLNKPDTNTDTYGHGLTSAPEMIILKRYESTASSDDWYVYHKYLGNSTRVSLNSDASPVGSTGVWGSTTPTTSVFTLQNQLGGLHIAYCMHSVAGYQKIDSYAGNGSTTGPIIDTGFEVAWLLIRSTGGNHWVMKDNKRSTSNPRTERLKANLDAAENTGADVDFLANGFQIKSASNEVNDGSTTYIYWAIAADPSTASTPSVTNAFDVVNYTGNGSTQEILTDTNPDLVLIKGTDTGSSSSGNFVFFDTVRDAGSETDAPHFLASNLTNGEFGNANTGVVSFDEKGFTVTDDANGGGNVNGASGGLYSNGSYTAFLWSAGSHEGNLPTINTQGTLDSTVSVNDAAGFSIVKYTGNGGTGQSVGTGMSSAPELVLFKRTDASVNWFVFAKIGGVYKRFEGLNTTNQAGSVSSFGATSTTITWSGTTSDFNGNGNEYIMYCFRSISGYSDIGTYDGNNSSKTVTTGFKPRWVMMKRTTAVGNWIIWDSINNPSADNSNNNVIYANLSDARSDAGSGRFIAFNSNGFTISGDSGNSNASGHTYLYFAIK